MGPPPTRSRMSSLLAQGAGTTSIAAAVATETPGSSVVPQPQDSGAAYRIAGGPVKTLSMVAEELSGPGAARLRRPPPSEVCGARVATAPRTFCLHKIAPWSRVSLASTWVCLSLGRTLCCIVTSPRAATSTDPSMSGINLSETLSLRAHHSSLQAHLKETLVDHGLQQVVHVEPFFSEPGDAPRRLTRMAGLEFRIPTAAVSELAPFGGRGASDWKQRLAVAADDSSSSAAAERAASDGQGMSAVMAEGPAPAGCMRNGKRLYRFRTVLKCVLAPVCLFANALLRVPVCCACRMPCRNATPLVWSSSWTASGPAMCYRKRLVWQNFGVPVRSPPSMRRHAWIAIGACICRRSIHCQACGFTPPSLSASNAVQV